MQSMLPEHNKIELKTEKYLENPQIFKIYFFKKPMLLNNPSINEEK